MSEPVLVALLALVGSLVGTFGGILATSKLTNHRLLELEKKVDKHNNLVERVYHIEGEIELYGEKFKVANHRISDLEGKSK